MLLILFCICYTNRTYYKSEKVYTIEELTIILQDIFKNFAGKKAILFGSYAKNTPTSKIDIDLAIDSEGKLLNTYFCGLLEELVQKLGKDVDLFEISEIQKGSKLYNDIITEGMLFLKRKIESSKLFSWNSL